MYNQVVMRGFCWSLISFNVNRFRLTFALKEQNKTLFFCFISEMTFFRSETSNELYLNRDRGAECENRARGHPSGALSLCCPPRPLLQWHPGSCTHSLRFGGQLILWILARVSSRSRPERLLLPSATEGLLFWQGG